MSLANLLDSLFGVKTTVYLNRRVSAVGLSPIEVIGNDPNRLSFLIVNLSNNNVYLAFDRQVSSTNGVLLTPNGGSLSMTWDRDFDAVSWAMYGVAAAADSVIHTIEVVEFTPSEKE